MWDLKYGTSERICETERFTDLEITLAVARGDWGRAAGRERDWEFGVSSCKLLRLEWGNNKVLLRSAGSYTQSSGVNHDGK